MTLQKQQRGTSTWKAVATVRTDAAVTASYRFTNGLSGSYRSVSVSTHAAAAQYASSVAVSTVASLTLTFATTSVLLGARPAWPGGSTTPRSPPPSSTFQYRKAGTTAWVTGPRATVRSIVISGASKLPRKGTYDARLSLRSGTAYVGAVSPSRRTVVR